jgi:hypothetical protein
MCGILVLHLDIGRRTENILLACVRCDINPTMATRSANVVRVKCGLDPMKIIELAYAGFL